MIVHTEHARPRLAPLATVLMALLGTAAVDAVASPAQPLAAAMPAAWRPGDGSGVAALMQTLRAAANSRGASTHGVVQTLPVTSCADDADSGTLRNVIKAAGNDDTVELAGLACSAITLTQGAIPVMQDFLIVHGRDAQSIAIDGGGVDRVFVHYGHDTLQLEGVTVRNGAMRVSGYKVAGGACILGNAHVTLDHSVVSGCTSIGEGAYGGAILALGVTLYTSKLVNNVAQGSLLRTATASYGGGAFAYRGTVGLYDSLVSGNRASADPANGFGNYDTGAGIFTDRGGTVVRSTIAANSTDGTGGGIASHGGLLVSNSTISGNSAGKNGGGMYVHGASSLAIGNSTVALNTALAGGGIYIRGHTQPTTLQSTIVADNHAPAGGADIASLYAITIGGANNLVIGSEAGITLPPDTLHAEPLLRALADNGGPTPTHGLVAGSPAIDHGNNVAGLDTDQRGAGFARSLGSAPDIGAVESAVAAPAAVTQAAPALSRWMLVAMAALLGGIGARRRLQR